MKLSFENFTDLFLFLFIIKFGLDILIKLHKFWGEKLFMQFLNSKEFKKVSNFIISIPPYLFLSIGFLGGLSFTSSNNFNLGIIFLLGMTILGFFFILFFTNKLIEK